MKQTILRVRGKSGASVVIDGRTFTGDVVISGDGTVTMNGETQGSLVGPVTVVVHGDCDLIDSSSGRIEVTGSAGSVKTMSGDVECGDVLGSIRTMSGDVTCGSVSGSTSTMSGDIRNLRN